MRTHLARLRRHRLLVLALAVLGAQLASAQTSTWTGATDTSLNTAANWDALPTSSPTTALIVGSSTRTTIVNDVAGGLTLNSLTFTADAGTYTLSGTPLIFSGTNATLASYSTASADVTLSGGIQLANTLTVEGDAGDFAGQLLLTGVISGTGGLVWHSGVGFISGSNTYTGGTLVSGGVVGINKASGLGTGPVVVDGGALQLQGGINVNRTLTLSGAGSEGLPALHSSQGSNTWSGSVTLASDATIGSFRSTSSSSLTVSGALDLAGHTLTVDARATDGETGGTTTTTLSGALTGSGNIIKTGGGTLFLQNFTGSTWTGDLNVQAGTLLLYGSYDPLGALTNNLTLASGTTLTTASNLEAHNVLLDGVGVVTVNGANTGSDFLANLSGTAGLTIAQGSVNLIGNNTFSGALTVAGASSAATLQLNSATRLGTSSAPLTLNNGNLLFNDAASTFTFGADHDLALGASGGTLIAAAGKTITVAGDISGAGKLTITGTSTTVAGGTFIVTGANSHSGGTLVSLATLAIGSDDALGATSGALDLNKGTLRATDDFTVAATRTTVITGTSTVDTQGFDVTFAQARTGTGTLVKTGTGTLTLSGSGVDGSRYTVSRGTLTTTLDHVLGFDSSVDLAADATLRLGGDASLLSVIGNGTVDIAANKTLTVSQSSRATLTGTGSLLISGVYASFSLGADTSAGITVDGGTLIGANTFTLGGTAPLTISPTGGTLQANSYNTITLDRSLSGSGALTLTGRGTYDEVYDLSSFGTWRLNTATAHTGATTISNANVELAADHALGSGALTLSGAGLTAIGAPRTLGQAITINESNYAEPATFSGENLTLSGIVTLNTSAGLVFNNSTTFSGTLNAINGHKLRVSGPGTLYLDGTANHDGGEAFVVSYGARLAGSGTINAPLYLESSGAVLAPGHGLGTLTVNGDVDASYGTLSFEIGGLVRGTGYDSLLVNGTLTFGDYTTFELSLVNGYTLTGGESFDLIDASTFTGTFGTLNLPTLTGGLAWDTSALATTGILSVTASAIPEPSTYAALAGLTTLGLAAYRRRRQKC